MEETCIACPLFIWMNIVHQYTFEDIKQSNGREWTSGIIGWFGCWRILLLSFFIKVGAH